MLKRLRWRYTRAAPVLRRSNSALRDIIRDMSGEAGYFQSHLSLLYAPDLSVRTILLRRNMAYVG